MLPGYSRFNEVRFHVYHICVIIFIARLQLPKLPHDLDNVKDKTKCQKPILFMFPTKTDVTFEPYARFKKFQCLLVLAFKHYLPRLTMFSQTALCRRLEGMMKCRPLIFILMNKNLINMIMSHNGHIGYKNQFFKVVQKLKMGTTIFYSTLSPKFISPKINLDKTVTWDSIF
jgi:hypothetical protein